MPTNPFLTWFTDGLNKPGRSQSALARHMGVPASVVNKIVNGKRKLSSGEVAQAAAYFGEPAPAIIATEEKPPLAITPYAGALITEPGLYDIDEAAYHADPVAVPSLSSTLARTLLNQSPLHAWHAHPRLNVEPDDEDEAETKATLDWGRAAHAMLLGRGAGIAVIDAKDFKTKAAKDARDEARAAGLTPIKAADYRQLEKIIAAARRQMPRYADALPDLLGQNTVTEHCAVWREGGIWCRALLDMIQFVPGAIHIVDYKSTDASAAPTDVGKRMFSMGYDVQLAFYRRGIMRLVGPDCPPVRCFLMSQERKPPYALTIVEADADVLTLADKKVAAALQLWATCTSRGEWPCYPPFVSSVTLPPWAETRWLEREVNDDALAGAGWAFAMPITADARGETVDVLAAG